LFAADRKKQRPLKSRVMSVLDSKNMLIIIPRSIDILASSYLLFEIYLSLKRVWPTAVFQSDVFNGLVSLIPSTLPPLLLSILILLPWKFIKNNILWIVLFSTLIVSSILYLIGLYIADPTGNLFFIGILFAVISTQILSIIRIRKIVVMT